MSTKTQIPKPKPKITQNPRLQTPSSPKTQIPRPKNHTQNPNPKTQMFWVGFGIVTSLPQARPIETIWSLLEQVYEGGWKAKTFKSIGKKDNFEGKAIGSKRGNTYDFRYSKKNFEIVQR